MQGRHSKVESGKAQSGGGAGNIPKENFETAHSEMLSDLGWSTE